jgi:hypothetical protein
MTEEELNIWFWDKYNSCYPVKCDDYPSSVYMFYDTNYIRSKKLANILGKEVEYPTEVKGECLFSVNYMSKFLWCDMKIWSFFQHHYNSDSLYISHLIRSWFIVHDVIPNRYDKPYEILEEYDKLKVFKY